MAFNQESQSDPQILKKFSDLESEEQYNASQESQSALSKGSQVRKRKDKSKINDSEITGEGESKDSMYIKKETLKERLVNGKWAENLERNRGGNQIEDENLKGRIQHVELSQF